MEIEFMNTSLQVNCDKLFVKLNFIEQHRKTIEDKYKVIEFQLWPSVMSFCLQNKSNHKAISSYCICFNCMRHVQVLSKAKQD